MHKAKSPPFIEKGLFLRLVWSQWVVFYKTVKKILFILHNCCSYEQNMLRIMNKK